MSDERIGVAIIGSGIFVREQHLPAVQSCPTLHLQALYSRTFASARALQTVLPDSRIYAIDHTNPKQTYAALLARPDIHAVIIALPIPAQPAFVRQALAAGKHVLAEKPLAADLATGRELLRAYRDETDTATVNFAVAEQFRYFASYTRAAELIAGLGRVLNFRVRLHALIEPGAKYFETAWRKTPEYQGGFLLDGGVHFVAGLRMMLAGGGERVVGVSAYTALAREWLGPVDTVDAVGRLGGGGTGTVSISFGTEFKGGEWSVACEGGVVTVDGMEVRVRPKGGEETVEVCKEEVEVEGVKKNVGGVAKEVFAWAEACQSGKWDARQSGEEALADLEMLEGMLKSGESGGQPVEMKLQT